MTAVFDYTKMSDPEFRAYHEKQAADGDPVSRDTIATLTRIEQHKLYRHSVGKGVTKGVPASEGTGEAPE